ncbi:sulfotransferase family 2 domain-containing protein [Yoonia sp.]|uniref:sulfotransferase family 2 domain-containing protein n=1 Tax=Yoonia sp. TaxID=2212373 RepID=UPI0019F2F670|nr:sulfotransferase family 2 domain-containing protein [Yoonia sp.]MBE0413074.1 sulfotransferase family 2 domain-containing protein [Yoonia sp.]
MSVFDYFIVLAEMRTGSNFLESNLNRMSDVTCYGEAFNPAFIGYPNSGDLLGISRAQREKQPELLLDAIKASPGLGGFRFFNDHDPRVLNTCLADPRCAKIILTRNPIDSFVSLQIARMTGQWKMTNVNRAKPQHATFDPEAFALHLETIQAFQVLVLNTLQKSGQTAFYLAYEDLQDLDVINGLAAYLGAAGRLAKLDRKLKKQNPGPMSDKVVNFSDMAAELARFDRFDLHRTPNFEPRRGPAIPTYIAPPTSALLYMPLRSGPDDAICDWLARLDNVPESALLRNFAQKSLRDWMGMHPGFRSFAVLRHPVARAHAVFCDRILSDGPNGLPELRATLRKVFQVPVPADATDALDDAAVHKVAFLGFLRFLHHNLSGQTSVRIDPSWASQCMLLQGMAQFAVPDIIAREDRLEADLQILAKQVGLTHFPDLAPARHPQQDMLDAIYDQQVESAVRDAYARDYLAFGFANWA